MTKRWKWSKWWQVWVANLKIWWKLGNTNQIERRSPSGGRRGAKNTITFGIIRRRRHKNMDKKCWHCWIATLRRMPITIICPWLQAHIQMRNARKTISTPFFARIWNVQQTTHAIVKKKKLESIDLVLQY
jgi:hypothetical protein